MPANQLAKISASAWRLTAEGRPAKLGGRTGFAAPGGPHGDHFFARVRSHSPVAFRQVE